MFKSAFKIEQLNDTYFKLLQDLVYESEEYGLKIRVPEGFVSDGPSVQEFHSYSSCLETKARGRQLYTIGCTATNLFPEI